MGPRIESGMSAKKLETALSKHQVRLGSVTNKTAQTCHLCRVLLEIYQHYTDTKGRDLEPYCYLLPLSAHLTLSHQQGGKVQINRFTEDGGIMVPDVMDVASDVYVLFSTIITEPTASEDNALQWRIPQPYWYRFKVACGSAMTGRSRLNHVPWSDESVNWTTIKTFFRGCDRIHRTCTSLHDTRTSQTKYTVEDERILIEGKEIWR
jgi:hypothetical protein